MKKVYFLLGFVGLVVIILFAIRLSSPEDDWICSNGEWQKHGHPSAAMPTTLCPGSISSSTAQTVATSSPIIPSATEPQATFSSEAMVLSPKQNEVVSSPLKIEGQALGSWFFEASLPVKLVAENGNLIAAHFATAESDWMTEKPVKFNSELIFSTTATSGYLIISKDNPSGLPEHDGSIKVPVRFK
ncbi:MAG: Gmad2 immunoglobulin-like domain-containing protein [Patescibacteria group bacterium]